MREELQEEGLAGILTVSKPLPDLEWGAGAGPSWQP